MGQAFTCEGTTGELVNGGASHAAGGVGNTGEADQTQSEGSVRPRPKNSQFYADLRVREQSQMSYREEKTELQFSHDQQAPCMNRVQRAQARSPRPSSRGETGRRIRANRLPPVEIPASLRTPTSLAKAGALQAVACLVCSGHQGLGKAAVGKNGAVRRAAQTGPVAGEITLVLGG